MREALKAAKEELRCRLHYSLPVQGRWLGQVNGGYLACHGNPGNFRRLDAFRHCAGDAR